MSLLFSSDPKNVSVAYHAAKTEKEANHAKNAFGQSKLLSTSNKRITIHNQQRSKRAKELDLMQFFLFHFRSKERERERDREREREKSPRPDPRDRHRPDRDRRDRR